MINRVVSDRYVISEHPICLGKRTYFTWSAADRVARRMRRSYDEDLIAYHCRVCGKFHVGNKRWSRRD